MDNQVEDQETIGEEVPRYKLAIKQAVPKNTILCLFCYWLKLKPTLIFYAADKIHDLHG